MNVLLEELGVRFTFSHGAWRPQGATQGSPLPCPGYLSFTEASPR